MKDTFKTIVGGRSAESSPSGKSPHGIEVLLKKASLDADFAKVLLESPDKAAHLIGLHLRDSERRILANTPADTLQTMIRHTRVQRQQLSAFKTMSAALMLAAVVTASTLPTACDMGCTPTQTKGISADDELASCRVQMTLLQTALDAYYAEHNCFVTTEAWYSPDNPVAEYLRTPIKADPWANPYYYEGIEQDGRVVDYLLQSYGPDGIDSADDLECTKDTKSW
ncbi:MAG: hypothetical protein QUS33_05255 [Dehalococcoidia bacterium]|nr:hypothetical protein [Dehalococcoidia bacterium]